MASMSEQILEAVRTALDAPGKPDGLTVHRARGRPIDEDDLPAIVVYRNGEPQEVPEATGTARWGLQVRIECRARGVVPDTAVDPLIVWAIKVLRADPTLGGLVPELDILIRRTPAVRQTLSQDIGAEALDVRIRHETEEDDPEVGV